MEEKISRGKYFVITIITCLAVIFNLLYWHNQIIGITFGLIYLIFYSFIIGSIFVKKPGWQIVLGLIFLLAVIAIITAGVIYLYKFNDYFFIFLILLIPALIVTPYYRLEVEEKFSLKRKIKDYLDKFDERREPKINGILVLAYLISAAGCFILLFLGQTTESIQSPWEVVSQRFFLGYFLATAILLTYLFNSYRTKLPLILIVIHTFLSSSVALIVYKIGYGFDPFIHQATEKIILQTGTITPKPLYYLGQYGIITFLQKLTTINISWLDRLLVPVLFAITIPTTIFYTFAFWFRKNYSLVLALLILAIPYTGFIMTAPQNLANLFFISALLLSLPYFRNQLKIGSLYLLALAAMAIHPIAGIPLVIIVMLFQLFKFMFHKSYFQCISLYFLTALVFIPFLPLAFIINGANINFAPDLRRADLQIIAWVNQFDLPLDLIYLINVNKIALAILIIIVGIIYISKNKLLKNNSAYLAAFLVIFSDFIIVKYFLNFSTLNEYDQGFFVSRLLLLSFYILLPFFLLGCYTMIRKIWKKDLFTKLFTIFILAGLITASLYLSYPRLNKYEPAKFFSLSMSDINAVNYIESTAQDNHIVLANQMVGVAAIKQFGFKKYYNNQFYYSMPMGDPKTFYDYYLEMIYEGAQKETMQKAMAEAGVNVAYFVLNKYWRNSEKIAAQAMQSADSVYYVDNDNIYIFKYIR